jgi:catechol 2,3-dioxygenase-like lactoylglutathione lyase family enzyme
MEDPVQKITPWAFVLAVPDMRVSAAYFRDILGFRVLWEEAADWRLVERDGFRVMLGHCPEDIRASETGSHRWFGYISVDDVNLLYNELAARGAIITTPTDRDYGMREVAVTTIDGHRIVFAQEMVGG